jgi:hypothetical protein
MYPSEPIMHGTTVPSCSAAAALAIVHADSVGSVRDAMIYHHSVLDRDCARYVILGLANRASPGEIRHTNDANVDILRRKNRSASALRGRECCAPRRSRGYRSWTPFRGIQPRLRARDAIGGDSEGAAILKDGDAHKRTHSYGQSFGVDVAFGDPMLGEPEAVVAEDMLAFPGIAPPTLSLDLPPRIERYRTRRVNFTFRYVPDADVVPFARLPAAARDDVSDYIAELARYSAFFAATHASANR